MEGDARFDVVVVGAGPAGIAAATCAAQSGRRVALVDDNGDVGGQIWRGRRAGRHGGKADRVAARWIERLEAAGVQRLEGTRIGAVGEDRALLAQSPRGPVRIEYASLILATGARERFVPLPGWTLPGVVGVGGIQALAKSGLPVEGKRIVLAGTGPLLLAVAGYLAQRGARIVCVAEQASSGSLLRFAIRLIGQPRKILQGLALRRQMRCGLLTDCWPTSVAAQGDRLRVRLQRRGRRWEETCDYFACGYGLVASLELPALLGCRLEGRFVAVDKHQRTSVPEVYAVGELTGIGGVEAALVEGQIAGHVAAGRDDSAARHRRRRDRAQRFAAAMERAFALRPELRELADDRTIVCRCEDVTLGQIKSQPDWRSAKLLTRCGMGACQGRLCGEATRLLLGYGPTDVRPPIFPLPLGSLVEPPPGEGPAGL